MPEHTPALPFINDSKTYASETVSPTAQEWFVGVWMSPRAAADLTGVPLDLVEDLVCAGKVRTELGGRRIAVEDVVAAAGGTA